MNYPPQPVLTSHEANPRRGKQRFDVQNPRRAPERDAASDLRPQHLNRSYGPRKPQSPRREPKPQSFCHDQMLAAFKGVKIRIVFACGELGDMKLIDLDRYTLLCENADGVRTLIFKSDIASIRFPRTP